MRKLLRVLVSCMVIALAIFPAAALAASGMQDGLQLSLTTDKGSYAKNETIGINAAVTNTNSFDVIGVKLELIVPTGLQFKTSGATGIMNLTSGQTTDLTSEAVLINNPDDMPQTGDYSPVELLLLLVLLSGGALACLLIIKRKKRVGFLAILLCFTLLSSSCILMPAPAYAVPAEKSFTVSLPVSVDGEGYNLQAILTYNPPVPTPYAVTVNNGTGDGVYAPGSTVTITADDPSSGYTFTGWTVVSGGVSFASATSATTTFTMPDEAVEVTATYDLITYAVTVNSGTGDGKYAPGATVTITADAPSSGYTFTGWTVVSGGVSFASATSATTTFTMPDEAVEVTAIYDLITYSVTVNNGIGNGDYAPGATVTIIAVTPYTGYAFAAWLVVSGGVTLHSATSATTTFTMPDEAVEVTATYKPIPYAVTVNNGTGGGDYAPGATVTITADTPSTGYAFAGWSVVSGGATLNSATSATTTFTMPDEAVEVTATYDLITYAVTVNNGTGGGNYAPGATVTITADTPSTGYAFAGWSVVSGGATLTSSTSATTTFTMPDEAVEVTATYDLITYAVTVNNGTGGGNYAPGTTVTIAATPPAGNSFTGWTVVSGGVTLASSTSLTTTFTMPEKAVEITAAYELTTYTVTVKHGSGSGNYAPGDIVTITHSLPSPYFFFGWTVVSGGVTLTNADSSTTTFTMPANPVAIKAMGHTTDNFSPSSNITMTTVLGGLLNQAALVGGTNATALGSPYTLSEDNTSSLARTIAKDSTITYFTATFTTKSAMALIGSTITVYADIYVAPSGSFNYSRVHTLTLSPALTGIVNIDTKCTGESIGLNLSVSEGDKVIILCRSNVIAGLDTAQTLTGSFAAGLTTYIK